MNPRVSLALAHWPDADRKMWDMLTRGGGPLDDLGALSHLKPVSLEGLCSRYGLWLAWLQEEDPAALLVAPAERATPAGLRAWLAARSDLAPVSQRTLVDGVVRVLSAAQPEANWEAHQRLRKSLRQAAARSTSPRKAGRVLSTSVLLQAGCDLAGPLADAASTPLEKMKRRRDGAMIATLALMPLRRRSFCELALGRSVHVAPERILFELSGDMTKNGQPWSSNVPEPAAPVLRRYIDEVRPWLMNRRGVHHDMLWIGEQGKPFDPHYFGNRIGNLTQQLLGIRVSPHLFRDAAATSLARMSPENAGLIRPLLGHSSFGTAERHYIQAQGIKTGRDYAAVLKQLGESQ